ncbi:hypothetical protein EGO53_04880 [Serratia liquefaciens]|uniref:Uncharacterized protein n=1 Tax=Serratia liquefaciens TaxID=614 RepID=A0A515CSM0_SERLI|nr:hypothetical protein EGO53_04880 [Serratia liquefaciens]
MSGQPNVKCLFSPAAISFGYDGFRGNMRTGSLPHDENRHAYGGKHHVTGERADRKYRPAASAVRGQVPPATE